MHDDVAWASLEAEAARKRRVWAERLLPALAERRFATLAIPPISSWATADVTWQDIALAEISAAFERIAAAIPPRFYDERLAAYRRATEALLGLDPCMLNCTLFPPDVRGALKEA
jgi:hypothetical protein